MDTAKKLSRTARKRLIDRAILVIIDSGNPDLSTVRIFSAVEGAADLLKGECLRYHNEPKNRRQEKLIESAVRAGVLKHPRYKAMVERRGGDPKPELVQAARTVMSNLEAAWQRINGDQMPIQELGLSRVSDLLARNYHILEVALRKEQA